MGAASGRGLAVAVMPLPSALPDPVSKEHLRFQGHGRVSLGARRSREK